jgi:hypothetical protein
VSFSTRPRPGRDGRCFGSGPLSKTDIKRFSDQTPPDGPILAIRTAELAEKEAVLAANPRAFFTIKHFHGYATVLVQLTKVTKKALRDALLDGWLACAPPPLADDYARRTLKPS